MPPRGLEVQRESGSMNISRSLNLSGACLKEMLNVLLRQPLIRLDEKKGKPKNSPPIFKLNVCLAKLSG